ncbi:MAG: hypothetical protein ABJC07_12040 [Acidobacteriota bacterium]
MPTSTSPLALALQKADREFRASAETEEDITRPIVLARVPRRPTRDSEPTLRILRRSAEAMQVDDELEFPRPDDSRR